MTHNSRLIVEKLRSSLLPLEGEPGTTPRGYPVPFEAAGVAAPRHAAVLLLLFSRGERVSFLLTGRPHTLSRHPGQISLPGGAAEPGDITLWQTALRESQEEIGLKTGRLRPLGRLETVEVTVSNYLITPFVAWNPVPPRLHPDPREVAEVIEVPLDALLDPTAVSEEVWELRGMLRSVIVYRFGETLVWGATARILAHLAVRLRPEEPPMPLMPGSVRPA
jgi:8-oxo-dGTP pyrophosphatase MutT (NUDIX family)